MISSLAFDIHPSNQYRFFSDMNASEFRLPIYSFHRKLAEDGSTKWGSKSNRHEVADAPEKRSEGEFRVMTVAGGPSWRLSQLTSHRVLLAKVSETFQKDTSVNTPQRHLNIRDGGSFWESEDNTGCTENTKSSQNRNSVYWQHIHRLNNVGREYRPRQSWRKRREAVTKELDSYIQL